MSAIFHILVVDDEPRLRKTLAMIIHGAGYQTTGAGDAYSALKALSETDFDLLILDWQLPDLDGVTLLKEIRRLYPGLPVVVITGNGTAETSETVMRLGGRYLLLKPFDPRFIVSLVGDILRKDKVLIPDSKLYKDVQARYTHV